MVSMRHECLVDLFRNRPSLSAELLDEALHVSLPAYTEARLVSVDLTETQPAEFRADVVVLLLDGETAVRVLIVEVQLSSDEEKRFTWPAYLTIARRRYRCPADLLIVAPDVSVAGWCAEPIEVGAAGFVLRPSVLRRDAVPVVTDPVEAENRPELGVLSAMTYGETEAGVTIAEVVLPVVRRLDDERAKFYYDLVYAALGDAARQALEAKMVKGYQYQSDFAKKYVAQGRAEGRAESLLTALDVRGVFVPEDTRKRILAEQDPDLLQRWLKRAIVASSLAEILDEAS